MKLSDFNFELPHALIAQTPARPRNHARLLVYDRKTSAITDDHFYNLGKYLPPNTTLVLNNSKVEKSRLLFGAIETFVLEALDPRTIRALVRPGKKFRPGAKVDLVDGLSVQVLAVGSEGIRTLRLNRPIDDKVWDKFRRTPLPPYIKQDESLAAEYQTVYAEAAGSKAAPTAGLHFTPQQLAAIRKSHAVAELTLHVGLGTFAPVKSDDIDQHVMHHEWYEVSETAVKTLNAAQHVTAVGTTSARTLESLARPFKAASGQTNIFIKPGYNFKNVDALVTNFHLPKSTLLMLVSAFMGSTSELHRVYEHAITKNYRFYSFGDAMLIL